MSKVSGTVWHTMAAFCNTAFSALYDVYYLAADTLATNEK